LTTEADASRPARRRLLTWGLPALAVAAGVIAAGCTLGAGSDGDPTPADTSRSSSIAWSADGRALWLTSPDDDQVVEVDPATLEPRRRLAMWGQPRDLTVLGDQVVVTARLGPDIAVIDTHPDPDDPLARDGATVTLVPTPCRSTAGVVTIPAADDETDRALAVVACPADDRLVVIDLDHSGAVGTIAVAGRPTGLVRDGDRIGASTAGDGRIHTFGVDQLVRAVAALPNREEDGPVPALDVRSTAQPVWVDGDRTASSLTALDAGPDGVIGTYQVVDNERKLSRAEIEAGSTYGTPKDGRARLEPAIAGACGARFSSLTDEARRLSGPVALAAAPADDLVWVVGEFSHSVSVVRCAGEGASTRSDTVAAFDVGEGARGIVLSPDGDRAFVDVGFDHQVAELRLPTGAADRAGDDPIERRAPVAVGRRSADDRYLSPLAQEGRRMFNDATNPHLTPFGVVTCGSCHPAAGEDALSWRIESADASRRTVDRKVRRTPPAWQVDTDVKPLHWDGEFTSSDALALDTVQQLMGGDGLLVDTAALTAYMAEVPALPGLTPESREDFAANVDAGDLVDRLGCTTCHTGDAGTDGKRHDVLSPSSVPDGDLPEVVTPPLRSVGGRAPYGHDGRAPDLEALLDEHGDGKGGTIALTPEERAAVIAYLETR
jgi:DNA-binding beta-propeller fold protein YncE/mono/diheme cytochrome c family protein